MTHPGAPDTTSPSYPRQLEQAAGHAKLPPALSTAAIGDWSAPAALWTDRLSGHEPRNPFEMWLSLFPIAPLFGVRWIWSSAPSAAYDALMAAREQPGAEPAAPSWKTQPRPLSPAEAAARAELEALKLDTAEAEARPEPAAPSPQPVSPQQQSALEPAARGPLGASLAFLAPPPVSGAASVEVPPNLLTARPAQVDDLTKISGVGPRVAELLNEAGVYHYAQIAEMTPAQLRWLDERLYVFKGRAERDAWGPQARALANRA